MMDSVRHWPTTTPCTLVCSFFVLVQGSSRFELSQVATYDEFYRNANKRV